MMTSNTNLETVLAGVVALIVTIVSLKSLSHCSALDNPLISICVGFITFIAFLEMGDYSVAILIPYQALGISIIVTVLLLLLMMCYRRFIEISKHNDARKKRTDEGCDKADDEEGL